MGVYKSDSVADTEALGKKLAETLKGNDIVAFSGGLGMGKTAFVRGMCAGLGFQGECSSPTFAIVHEYSGGRLTLYHFDMYRIASVDDLYACGYFDYTDTGAVLAVEWSENIAAVLPDDAILVDISRGESDGERIITITGSAEL